MDVWYAPRKGEEMWRVTGNWRDMPAPRGRGAIEYHIVDDTGKKVDQVWYAWQGLEGKSAGLAGDGRGVIRGVPSGKIWVKCWKNKHLGDVVIVDVPVNGTVKAELKLTRGNRLATYPSITPDGKYVVCLSQHAYYDAKQNVPEQGFDTMAVVDAKSGRLVAMWDPTKNGGHFAKDPRLSWDGKWIAFAMGMPGMESLAVCSLESFLAGRPDTRVVVRSDRVLGQGTLGNTSPAWSPDNRKIVFVRYFRDRVPAGDEPRAGARRDGPDPPQRDVGHLHRGRRRERRAEDHQRRPQRPAGVGAVTRARSCDYRAVPAHTDGVCGFPAYSVADIGGVRRVQLLTLLLFVATTAAALGGCAGAADDLIGVWEFDVATYELIERYRIAPPEEQKHWVDTARMDLEFTGDRITWEQRLPGWGNRTASGSYEVTDTDGARVTIEATLDGKRERLVLTVVENRLRFGLQGRSIILKRKTPRQ
jgi:hypothetical protein